jgi:hypothetical protein
MDPGPLKDQISQSLCHCGSAKPGLREGSGRRGTVYVLARLLNLCEGRDVY